MRKKTDSGECSVPAMRLKNHSATNTFEFWSGDTSNMSPSCLMTWRGGGGVAWCSRQGRVVRTLVVSALTDVIDQTSCLWSVGCSSLVFVLHFFLFLFWCWLILLRSPPFPHSSSSSSLWYSSFSRFCAGCFCCGWPGSTSILSSTPRSRPRPPRD